MILHQRPATQAADIGADPLDLENLAIVKRFRDERRDRDGPRAC